MNAGCILSNIVLDDDRPVSRRNVFERRKCVDGSVKVPLLAQVARYLLLQRCADAGQLGKAHAGCFGDEREMSDELHGAITARTGCRSPDGFPMRSWASCRSAPRLEE